MSIILFKLREIRFGRLHTLLFFSFLKDLVTIITYVKTHALSSGKPIRITLKHLAGPQRHIAVLSGGNPGLLHHGAVQGRRLEQNGMCQQRGLGSTVTYSEGEIEWDQATERKAREGKSQVL